jgi:hypothetical protein
MGQGLDLAAVDDDAPLEESARRVYSTVSDDEVDSQNRSPIHPALIHTYIFLRLQDEFIRSSSQWTVCASG